jgi:hypothetical protein
LVTGRRPEKLAEQQLFDFLAGWNATCSDLLFKSSV